MASYPVPAALYASPTMSILTQKSWSMVPVISLETTSWDQQECPYLRLLIASCQVAFQKAEQGGGYSTDHTCTPHSDSVGPSRNTSLLGASRQNSSPRAYQQGHVLSFSPGSFLFLSLIPAKKRVHGLTAPEAVAASVCLGHVLLKPHIRIKISEILGFLGFGH